MPRSSPDLLRVQRSIREALTDPRGVREAVKARPGTLLWITDAPPSDATTRLSVYGDGYFLRLLEALTSDFPAVKRSLGEGDFQVLAADYLERTWSRSPSLADLGEDFPRFVSRHPLAGRYPFLPDLAKLERGVMTRLYAERLPPLDPEVVAAVPPGDWPRVRLILDPTVMLLKVSWPVERLWRRRDLPPEAGGRRLRRAFARWLLIFRDETWVRVADISREEWETLRRIKEGARLGRVLARASKSPGRPDTVAVRRWFSAWVEGGLVKRITNPEARAAISRAKGEKGPPKKLAPRDINACAGRHKCA